MNLSRAQYQQFEQTLLHAFPTRTALARMVRFGIGENLGAIAGGDNLTDIVFTLIEWAESTGQLDELVIGAYRANPGNEELQAFVEQYGRYLWRIPYTYIARLLDIVAQVTLADDDLRQLYDSIAPGSNWTYPQRNNAHETLSHILLLLAQAPPVQNPVRSQPLLQFIKHFAAINEPSVQAVRDKLQGWLAEVAAELDIPLEPPNVPTKTDDQAYLLVQICPKEPLTKTTDLNTARFYVGAWLQWNNRTKELKRNVEHTLDGIPECFEELLEKSNDLLFPAECELTVEFFLPVELILYGFEHWEIEYGTGTEIPVAIPYRVVMRSFQRIHPRYLKRLWNAWHRKWNRVKEQGMLENSIAWVRTIDQCQPQSLMAGLLNKDIIGFAQIFATPENPDTVNSMLSTIIDAGIPIAFFFRHQYNLCNQEGQLEKVIKECLFAHIPTAVWEKRQEAASLQDKEHPINYLTLLWDEAEQDRLPPPARELFSGDNN